MRRYAATLAVVVGFMALSGTSSAVASERSGKPAFCTALVGYTSYAAQYRRDPNGVNTYFAKLEKTAPGSLKADVRVVAKASKTVGATGKITAMTTPRVITAERHFGTYLARHCYGK